MTGVDGWMNYGLRKLVIGYEYKWIIRSRNILIPCRVLVSGTYIVEK